VQISFLHIFLFIVLASALAFFLYLVVAYAKNRSDLNKFKKAINEQKDQILVAQKTKKKKDDDQKNELDNFLGKIEQQLLYAGAGKLNAFGFIMIVLTSALIGAFLFFFLVKNILAAFVGLFVLGYLPINILKMFVESRGSKFNIALSEAMSIVVRMMRNGVGFEQALKRSVEISPLKLLRDVFSVYLKEKDLVGDEIAFEKMSKHVDSNESRIFALSIMIGKSSGGKFSSTLEKLESSIRDRVKLQRKVAVATQEAKVGSYLIIALIGFIFIMMNESLNNKLVDYFFYTDEGRLYFMFVMLWVGIGLFLNSVMTKVR